ncbi:MAG: alpha/beta fold hydrolase [Acidimicrobiia bacterium]
MLQALKLRGHEAVPVELPAGDDTADFGDYARAVVEAIGDRRRLVLVAHSMAGFPAPLVCQEVPFELMVLVTAMISRPVRVAVGPH